MEALAEYLDGLPNLCGQAGVWSYSQINALGGEGCA